MLPVDMQHVFPGLVLAQTLFFPDGRVLLNEGVKLTERTIARLKDLGLPFIYVEDPVAGNLPVPRLIPERIRAEGIFFLHQQFEGLAKKKTGLDVQKLDSLASAIVSELATNRRSAIHLIDMRLPEMYLAGHAFHTAVLAVKTALAMGFKPLRLKDLALGALLHDVGYLFIPGLDYNRPGPLTEAEQAKVRSHPENGFEFIRKNGFLNILVSHCAFQHHERWDGSGYPRGLKKNDIHELGQILAVADVYDALVNERPHRKLLQPHQALKVLHDLAGSWFNPEVVTAITESIAIYPIGSRIQFPNGEIGVVVDTEPAPPFRPKIRRLPPAAQQDSLPTLLAVDLTSANKEMLLTDMVYVS
ncbi:HD domain-containing protein [Heliobacterium undosum]|uniref:HD domain-containing protein n=1 Tax=Heliomicrobium undosum TaxID=121734 RepID=A0A845L7K6_9FIRM|nr:HD-GYP domain-containing protein [Heliomicrobium undosum]MZP31269.1 HD domain-containing protein [Heliomicrobium undosum]